MRTALGFTEMLLAETGAAQNPSRLFRATGFEAHRPFRDFALVSRNLGFVTVDISVISAPRKAHEGKDGRRSLALDAILNVRSVRETRKVLGELLGFCEPGLVPARRQVLLNRDDIEGLF